MCFSIGSYCHSVSLIKFNDFRSSIIRAAWISSLTFFSHFSINTTKLNAWFFCNETKEREEKTLCQQYFISTFIGLNWIFSNEWHRQHTFLPPRANDTIKSFSRSAVSAGSMVWITKVEQKLKQFRTIKFCESIKEWEKKSFCRQTMFVMTVRSARKILCVFVCDARDSSAKFFNRNRRINFDFNAKTACLYTKNLLG